MAATETIGPGSAAPDFTLSDQSGQARSLADYTGRPVVLYFYPKDDTPGCTQQTCDFRDALPSFAGAGAEVLGISILDVRSKSRFANKYGVTFPLLADEDHAVAERYGVWQEKSRYGRKYFGIVRTTFLLDRHGTVARRWDNVKVPGHVREVAEAVAVIDR